MASDINRLPTNQTPAAMLTAFLDELLCPRDTAHLIPANAQDDASIAPAIPTVEDGHHEAQEAYRARLAADFAGDDLADWDYDDTTDWDTIE